ncbi:MAG: hypothetical protein ABI950_07120 [Solirubrobacteraceae bacterium]
MPFALSAAAFVVAAAVAAVVRIAAPFPRGWWLVAFLVLVGGLSQLLLGGGLAALAGRAGSPPPGASERRAQLALWNVGTVAVAVADLGDVHVGVLAGSVALLLALALFARGLAIVNVKARRPSTRLNRSYALLLVALGVSVAIGAGLAHTLPGR